MLLAFPACGSEERCRDVAPHHVRRRGVDPGDLARLDINANHNDRLAPVSPLENRLAARVRIVTPHPCEEPAGAGQVEVARDVAPTVGRWRALGRPGIEWRGSAAPLR